MWKNEQANSILYHALDRGLLLANFVNDESVVSDYQGNRTAIKAAANSLLWDETDGFFNDNTTTTLHPQDGNVWAVISGITDNSTQVERILENLQSRWTAFGPTSVEVSFISWILGPCSNNTDGFLFVRQATLSHLSSADLNSKHTYSQTDLKAR